MIYTRQNNELVEVKKLKKTCKLQHAAVDAELCGESLRNYQSSLNCIPIHPNHLNDFEFNKEYSDEDFEMIGDVSVRMGVRFDCRLAIPKQKETEDTVDFKKLFNNSKLFEEEFWRDVIDIARTNEENAVAELKSKYSITKQ